MKSAEAQAALLDHKARDFLIRQQTQTVNTIRAHLAEFGIVTPQACLRHVTPQACLRHDGEGHPQ